MNKTISWSQINISQDKISKHITDYLQFRSALILNSSPNSLPKMTELVTTLKFRNKMKLRLPDYSAKCCC